MEKGASPVTINLEQSYLSGVFSELARLGEWTAPNPLENMRKFTIAEKEMASLHMSKSQNFYTTANAKAPCSLWSLKSA